YRIRKYGSRRNCLTRRSRQRLFKTPLYDTSAYRLAIILEYWNLGIFDAEYWPLQKRCCSTPRRALRSWKVHKEAPKGVDYYSWDYEGRKRSLRPASIR